MVDDAEEIGSIREKLRLNAAERAQLEKKLSQLSRPSDPDGLGYTELPELDYAFLAEHAQVASGQLNVMGASYTHVLVDSLPAIHTVAVAGRVRAPKDMGPVEVTLLFSSPEGQDQYSIEGSIEIEASEGVRPYGNYVGLLFASQLQAPLIVEGLYEVRVEIAGVPARRLAFTVEARVGDEQ